MRSGEELIVRRELIAETGRSRLFINDTLASQETIKELRTTLLVHTSPAWAAETAPAEFSGQVD